ncbi:NTP transferase domain-containing protein [Sphingobacterium sp.]|uniref:NTP transferase domain-containing protein n=1 Tax=Sphingobacterium sp. TaxID=341027 RepID=UPI00289D68C5|nr:NTP transferase domain-containing protein [Sphingobacterium sp.]
MCNFTKTGVLIAITMVPDVNRLPILNGLVLIGGRSRRMGSQKEKIRWHGKEQRFYLADLLQNYCENVYISCRPEQINEITANDENTSSYAWLCDRYVDIGPMGGILTALEFQPERAWLVVACDLPMLEAEAVNYLIQKRDPRKIATAFKSPGDNFPEPLFAIWEPHSLSILQQMFAQNKLSPRHVLVQHHALCIQAPDVQTLTNVNTPTEATLAKSMITGKGQGR